MNAKVALVTGTTSGLGKEMAKGLALQGWEVVAVNRDTVDITSYDAVNHFLGSLPRMPTLFILNAGINRPDNLARFDYRTFHEVMRTNLDGVLTFVSAIAERGVEGARIVCLSSTSNIVPNPGHVGYFLSKWALSRMFDFLAERDKKNSYGAIVLGPVHTGIMRGYPGPGGLSGKIFRRLAVDATTAARASLKFALGRKSKLDHPGAAVLFYYAIRALLCVVPGLYRGTAAPPTVLSEAGSHRPGVASPRS